jgi:solute carrier family 39 (zinc transporter), member 1/2/3
VIGTNQKIKKLIMADQQSSSADSDVVIAKIISGVCLFVVSVICGVIPFRLAKVFKWVEPLDQSGGENGDKKPNKTVNILLCFGGGVLLATTFLHLLPDINHTIAWLTEEELLPKMDLALGELLMMIGFFLIYLIEEIVHNYLHRHQNKKKKQKEKLATDSIDDTDAFMRGITVRNSALLKKLSTASPEITHDNDKKLPNDHESHGHGHSHILPLPHSEEEDLLVSSLRGLLIVLALSIHELFEGFAVGLEKTSAGKDAQKKTNAEVIN